MKPDWISEAKPVSKLFWVGYVWAIIFVFILCGALFEGAKFPFIQ